MTGSLDAADSPLLKRYGDKWSFIQLVPIWKLRWTIWNGAATLRDGMDHIRLRRCRLLDHRSHISCRCVVQPVVASSASSLGAEFFGTASTSSCFARDAAT